MSAGNWLFPPVAGGIRGGIADSTQEIFTGDPDKFIARETIQNSLDARTNNSLPVVVKFRHLTIPVDSIPGVEELRGVMAKCHANRINEKGKGWVFFRKARNVLKGEQISVLSIEDYNTSGVTGDDNDELGKWLGLIKYVGRSTTNSESRGGTFGIGKGAPFLSSSIRTVLYSTRTNDGVAFAGVSRLTTFENKPGDIRQPVGFYERHPDIAIREEGNIPSQYLRGENGTNIYVLGYEPKNSEWRKSMLEDILQNCWLSIHDEKLEVELIDEGGDVIRIDKQTLRSHVEEAGRYLGNNKLNPLHYLDAVENGQYVTDSLPYLGKVDLWVNITEEGTKHVELMRSPRLVVESRAFPTLPFKFSGVFLCDDTEGNLALSEIEDPAHRQWMRSKNAGLVDALRSWIHQELQKLAPESENELLQVPDLSDYLPFDEEESGTSSGGENKGGTDSHFTEPEFGKPRSRRSVKIFVESESGGSGSRQQKGRKRGKNKDRNKQKRTSDGPERMIDTSQLEFWGFMTEPGVYEVGINAQEGISGSLKVKAIGEDDDYDLPLSEVRDLESGEVLPITGSVIDNVKVVPGKSTRLRVSVAHRRRYKVGI